jgi:signal peptidase I
MTFDNRSAHHTMDPDHDPDSQSEPSPDIGASFETAVELDEERSNKKQSSMVREIVETLLLALIIFIAVRSVVLNFRVDGLSMSPSLQNNEMLLVNRNVYFNFDTWAIVDWLPFVEHDETNVVYPFHPPERGDIIVFNPPVDGESKPYIKRVIGLPGETVSVHDDAVYVDGQRLTEPYLEGERSFCAGQNECPEVVVPEKSVFVMGDNRDNSTDSRKFGPVSTDRIIGKAWITYWPRDEIDIVPHFDYPEISDD